MCEVSRIPDDQICPVDRLSVLEIVQLGPNVTACNIHAVVNLVGVVAKKPEVGDPKGPIRRSRRATVCGIRADQILPTLAAGPDAPLAERSSIAKGALLSGQERPRAVVELLDEVVAVAADIKVEPPIAMVIVGIAYAGVLHCRESEAGLDCAVGVQSPLADVTIPAGL